MKELAAATCSPGKVYFTGGATALLLGFRDQTLEVDLKFKPEPAGVFEAIASLKNQLDINVELASPGDFIPAPPDWEARSRHIATIGPLQFFHFDLSLQALAKLERGHDQDVKDVEDFVKRGFVSIEELRARFQEIEPLLVRYPALDPGEFKSKVAVFLKALQPGG